MYADWFLRPMAAGLKSEIIKPKAVWCSRCDRVVRIANAIGMHCAMQVHAGHAIAVRLKHSFNLRWVGNIRTALIVHDDIKTFRVIRVAKDRQGRVGAGIIVMKEFDCDIRALLDALFEHIFLMRVIMAATTGDEQNAQRGWRGNRPTDHSEQEKTAQERGGFVSLHGTLF